MITKKQYVTIKGTREGLTLYLDDSCSFDDLLEELDRTLSQDDLDEEQMITLTVQLGNRYLHNDQEETLRALIRKKNKMVVQNIESNVILKQQALELKEESDVRTITKTVRSGQVVEVKGDLLLIGDVNPGATVKATGNVFIMGNLRGIAHAGYLGNKEAIIAASYMDPVQLRIAGLYSRSPDYNSDGVYLECGYVDDSGKIVIDRLQAVARKRPQLNAFERSVING
ncbi:septum site-determining protein MinC [Amphibacillus sediminis]|uniref:septum site-determining protein MinC n=1 Tax=Amphibacillus sediminis TaxID=360185 RepID=UPI0008323CA3|nr:septum site-determining protein MinC [Amphibacillus sediminis]